MPEETKQVRPAKTGDMVFWWEPDGLIFPAVIISTSEEGKIARLHVFGWSGCFTAVAPYNPGSPGGWGYELPQPQAAPTQEHFLVTPGAGE